MTVSVFGSDVNPCVLRMTCCNDGLMGALNPLKSDVSRGPLGLSGGPGPLGPHRNSTTGIGGEVFEMW